MKKNYLENKALFDHNSMKVIAIGCVIIILALLFMSITSMVITSNAVIHKLKTRDLDNMAKSIGSVIEGKIEKAVDAALILANDPLVSQWIEDEKQGNVGQYVEAKMEQLVTDFGYDTSFLVNNRTHHYWSYHDDTFELLDTVSSEDPSDDWFFNTIQMQKKYEINIDPNKELNDTFVWINVLIGDEDNPIGIAGLGMNLSQVINELINEDAADVKNDIWLVDENGIIYLSKQAKYLDKAIEEVLPEELTEAIIYGDQAQDRFKIAEYKDAQGEKQDIAYKNIKSTHWKLMVRIPRLESLNFLDAVLLNTIISCLIIILLMVVLFYFVSRRIANPYKRALQLNQELEKMVDQRTIELQEKNRKIQDSLEYAKKIQQTILPSHEDIIKVLKDYAVIFKPRDIVGGDFYWMKSHKEGVLLIVGDCTGHGVPGALMTTAVNAMLNQITDDICNDNPAVILNQLDRLLKNYFGQQKKDNQVQDGLDAGVLYISRENKILYAGANISVFVLRENGIMEIKGEKQTIDSSNDQKNKKHFKNVEIEYQENIRLYIATDGLTDQPGGNKKLPYGKTKLMNALALSSHMNMSDQILHIQQAFDAYAEGESMRDDRTFIGIQL